jgi:hypothetical protein
MQDNVNTLFAIIAFAIGFPIFWMGVVYLVSRLSGWSSLAKRYPATRPASGQYFGWSSGRISRFSNYNHSINVTISSTGVHLETVFFFKFGHAPVFLPWDAIVAMRHSKILFATSTVLQLADGGWPGTIQLYGARQADALAKAAPARLVKQD